MSVPRTAIITLTSRAAKLGERLLPLLEGSELFVPSQRLAGLAGIKHAHGFSDGAARLLAEVFPGYDRLLLIFSTGIAVRLIARCLNDKHSDPAVVVMDENGQYAISLLSGHIGGANDFARMVAQLIGATPVITTASDVQGTLSVDLLGQEYGWEIEDWRNVTRTAAAVVNGELVGVYQDAGERYWPETKPLPQNIQQVQSLSELLAPELRAALLITDRIVEFGYADILNKAVIYRPRSLVVGIGCNSGTAADEIQGLVNAALHEHALSPKSIAQIASIDVKRSEPGIMEYARRRGVPLKFFSSEQLAAVKGVVHQSETVLRHVGCRNVCEAAALLAAGGGELVIAKSKSSAGGATVAVARIPGAGTFCHVD